MKHKIKPKKYKGGGKFKVNFGSEGGINTLPLLQGLNALVTETIYNPRVRESEANMLRQQLTPVTSPQDFYGTEGPIYKKGGKIKRKNDAFTSLSDKDAEYYYRNNIPMPKQKRTKDSLTDITSGRRAYNPKQVTLPEVQMSDSPITYERLLDVKGNPTAYSPIFPNNYSRSQIESYLGTLPESFGGIPTIKDIPTYMELQHFKNGGTSTNFESNQPNAIVEGGEVMQLPDGSSMPIYGDKHSDPSGGIPMNLPEETRIFSDSIKADKEFSEYMTGGRIKKKMSIADLAKRVSTEKEDKILKGKPDTITQRTANIMKAAKEAKLNEIFDYQESLKSPKSTKVYRDGGEIDNEKQTFGKKIAKGVKKTFSQTGEFLPEAVALLQSMNDFPIMTAKYQPKYQTQPQGINIQDGLNRNYAQTQSYLNTQSGNPSVDRAVGAQALSNLYDANNQLYAQKFNSDAYQKFQTDSNNVRTENDANYINLQRADQFWDKVTRRKSVQNQSQQSIANSIYRKKKGQEYDKTAVDVINSGLSNFKYGDEGFELIRDKEGKLVQVPRLRG